MLPNNILKIIFNFLQFDENKNLSLVNDLFNKIYKKTCSKLLLKGYKGTNNNILVDILESYTNLKKLEIGEFSEKHARFLGQLSYHCRKNPEVLKNIKKLKFCGVTNSFNVAIEKLNAGLLTSLGRNVESVNISFINMEVQEILDALPQLKKFKINMENDDIDLSFRKQKNLTSVHFIKLENTNIFKSLKMCQSLQSIVLDDNIHSLDIDKVHLTLKTLLMSDKACWPNIRILDLNKMSIKSNIELKKITKNVPKLQYLRVNNIEVTDYTILGNNCPNLEVLSFNTIKGDNINALILCLPNLRALKHCVNSFTNKFTDEEISSLAKNCPKLQYLYLKDTWICENSTVKALVDCCELIVLNVRFIVTLVKDGTIRYLIENSPKLKYFFGDEGEIFEKDYKHIIFNEEKGLIKLEKFITNG